MPNDQSEDYLELLTTKKDDRGIKKFQNKNKDKQTSSRNQKKRGKKQKKKMIMCPECGDGIEHRKLDIHLDSIHKK